MSDPDAQFFKDHPDRQARIRLPGVELKKDKQRSVRYLSECEIEFRSLGPHAAYRRRILLWKVPATNPMYDKKKPQILKIPFLAYADETIEDTDAVLLPIIHELMEGAKARYG
jgi:hypothetical protein